MQGRWIAIALVVACGGSDEAPVDAAVADAPPIPDAPVPDAGVDAAFGVCVGDGTGQGNGGFVRPAQVSRGR